ncbi:MAG: hypothetical protein ACLSE4_16790 [Clostridium sp.]
MQKENTLTVEQWCDRWFTANRHKWNGNTEGGYRNLIYSHILPSIGNMELSDLTEQTVTGFLRQPARAGGSVPEVSGASTCFCGGAWTKRHGNSSFHTTRCGSARSPRQRNTKQPLCAWASSSVT